MIEERQKIEESNFIFRRFFGKERRGKQNNGHFLENIANVGTSRCHCSGRTNVRVDFRCSTRLDFSRYRRSTRSFALKFRLDLLHVVSQFADLTHNRLDGALGRMNARDQRWIDFFRFCRFDRSVRFVSHFARRTGIEILRLYRWFSRFKDLA